MSNQPLSRRQRAKLRTEKTSTEQVEVKSVFNVLSNNSNVNVNLFDQLMKAFSQDSQLAKVVLANSTVATCVDIIAMKVATLPLTLYKQQRDGKFVPVKGKRHTDHIFSKPNSTDTQITLIYKLITYFLTYGNAFLVKSDNQIFAIPPTKISVGKTDKGIATEYSLVIDNQSVVVPAKQVCQVFKPSVDGTYNSSVRNAIAEIMLDTEIVSQATNHIKSGCMIRGILTQDKDATSGLSQTQMSQLSRQFTEATSGDKASNTPMLPKGINYIPLQQSVAESGTLLLKDMSRKSIVIAFKIPESIFNSEAGASYATANIQEINFFKNTIKPICVLVESFVNYFDALTSETEYFRFELGDMVSAEEEQARATTKQVKATTGSTLKALGLNSPNEIRKATGYDDITDSQGALIPEANVNPFELGAFSQDPAEEVAEPVDDNSIVKKTEITTKKIKSCKNCNCGK